MSDYLSLTTNDKKFMNCKSLIQIHPNKLKYYLQSMFGKLFYDQRSKINVVEDIKIISSSPNDIYASWRLFHKYCIDKVGNIEIKDGKMIAVTHKPFTSSEIKSNNDYRLNRGIMRAKKIMGSIDLLQLEKFTPIRALDFGCGDGHTGALLFNSFNVKYRYGMDVFDHDTKTFPTTYIKKDEKSSIIETLKLHSNSLDSELKQSLTATIPIGFDIIFVNMVLHHIKDASSTIKELDSLLNKGGIFIFREHNCDQKDEELPFINFEHILYTIREKEYETNSSYVNTEQITYTKAINQWLLEFPKYKILNIEKEKDKFSIRKPKHPIPQTKLNNEKYSYDDPFTVILQKL